MSDFSKLTNPLYTQTVYVDNSTAKVNTPLDGGEYTLFMTIEELYAYFAKTSTPKKEPVKPVKNGHCNIDKKASKQRKTK